MVKSVLDLKKEYKEVNFVIREPILDIGGGPGNFLISQGIKDATILDATIDRSPKYSYIYADLTKKLPPLKKNLKQSL